MTEPTFPRAADLTRGPQAWTTTFGDRVEILVQLTRGGGAQRWRWQRVNVHGRVLGKGDTWHRRRGVAVWEAMRVNPIVSDETPMEPDAIWPGRKSFRREEAA